ncbi:hypothetical protein GQ649_26375 [Rhodococcus sp. DSM 6344]|nr:hypothetical protein [Rhodococcus erythropolis]
MSDIGTILQDLMKDESAKYVQTPQCLICGRFVATSTFHSLGMDINGEYTYRWHCSLCGFRVGS